MNARIHQVTLVVTDQDAALKFYTEKAGFEKKTDFTPPNNPRWVTVGYPGQDLELALYPVGYRSNSPEYTANWKPGSSPAIVVHVDNVQQAFEELTARGVKFREPKPVQYPWGTAATFLDPDGNAFSLVQPAWTGKP